MRADFKDMRDVDTGKHCASHGSGLLLNNAPDEPTDFFLLAYISCPTAWNIHLKGKVVIVFVFVLALSSKNFAFLLPLSDLLSLDGTRLIVRRFKV